MTAAHVIRKRFGNAFLSFTLLLLSGCSETDSSHLRANNFQQDSLMPTEIWLQSAMAEINNLILPDSTYQLFLSIEPELNNVILEFNMNRKLERAVVMDELEVTNTLYFDKGRLIYSHHSEKAGPNWIIAYANNQAYAAALKEKGDWKAVEPYVVPFDQILLQKTLDLAKKYSEIEQAGHLNQRILTDQFEITDEVEKRKSVNFRINVRKGEVISIALQNTSEPVFFTFANQSSSRMEYKKWSGAAEKTGDIIIQVFSAAETGNKIDFTLNVNHQILAEL